MRSDELDVEAVRRVALDQIERGTRYLLEHPDVPARMKAEVEKIATLARSGVFEWDAIAAQHALQSLARLRSESERLGLQLDCDGGVEA